MVSVQYLSQTQGMAWLCWPDRWLRFGLCHFLFRMVAPSILAGSLVKMSNWFFPFEMAFHRDDIGYLPVCSFRISDWAACQYKQSFQYWIHDFRTCHEILFHTHYRWITPSLINWKYLHTSLLNLGLLFIWLKIHLMYILWRSDWIVIERSKYSQERIKGCALTLSIDNQNLLHLFN